MGDYQKIFLILDPSRRRTPAFRRALHIARTTGAALHLGLYEHAPSLNLMNLVERPVLEQVNRAFREDRERDLDAMARQITDEGVATSSEVDLHSRPYEAIAERVLELKPDLVIKDIQHESLLSRVWFTPLDWHLARLCTAPLLFVCGRSERWPRRVVVAVDTLDVSGDDTFNDRIVGEALRLSLQCGGEVRLLHVFGGLPPSMNASNQGLDGVASAYEQLAEIDRQRFAEFAQRHGVPEERQHLLAGPPASTITAFACDATADLVVLGTTYRNTFDRLLMGSTAEGVINLARCDILVVQPEGFRAAVARHLGLAGRPERRVA